MKIYTLTLSDTILKLFYDKNGDALQEYEVEEELKKMNVPMSRPEFARVMEMLTESKYIVARVENIQNRSQRHMIATPATYFFITAPGKIFVESGGYSERDKKERKIAELNQEKLEYDVKNSKRIFRTYWWTFSLSIAGFITAATLAVLKLIEMLK